LGRIAAGHLLRAVQPGRTAGAGRTRLADAVALGALREADEPLRGPVDARLLRASARARGQRIADRRAHGQRADAHAALPVLAALLGAKRVAQPRPRRAAGIEGSYAPRVLVAVVGPGDHTVVHAGLARPGVAEHGQTHELPVRGAETKQTLVPVGTVLQIGLALGTLRIAFAVSVTIAISISVTVTVTLAVPV